MTTLLPRRLAPVQYLLSIVALANIILLGIVAANHLRFPLNLEPTETTVLEHVRRAMTGAPVYVEPTAQFTPLTSTPLFYYLSAGVARFAGLSLTTLREVTLLGAAGCAMLLYLIALRETRSKWLALMTLGLFFAAYQALDGCYDAGHRDSWLVFLVLLGCYLIGYSETRLRDALGMLCLVAAFWMNQQGALFVLGGLAYLVWRDVRSGASALRSWPSVVTAFLLGPALYLLLPTSFTGPTFHYFSGDLNREEIRSFAEFLARSFAVPAILAGAGLQLSLERGRPFGIWSFFLPVAFLSAVLALLTPGSNLNVFMPFGVWLMLTAVLALPRLTRTISWLDPLYFPAIALGLSFLALAYRPSEVLIPQVEANAAYRDLLDYTRNLEGQAQGKRIYILNNTPLKTDSLLRYAADSYVLERDLGDRFRVLGCLPRRNDGLWPRYLYRYDPQAALRLSASQKRP